MCFCSQVIKDIRTARGDAANEVEGEEAIRQYLGRTRFALNRGPGRRGMAVHGKVQRRKSCAWLAALDHGLRMGTSFNGLHDFHYPDEVKPEDPIHLESLDSVPGPRLRWCVCLQLLDQQSEGEHRGQVGPRTQGLE